MCAKQQNPIGGAQTRIARPRRKWWLTQTVWPGEPIQSMRTITPQILVGKKQKRAETEWRTDWNRNHGQRRSGLWRMHASPQPPKALSRWALTVHWGKWCSGFFVFNIIFLKKIFRKKAKMFGNCNLADPLQMQFSEDLIVMDGSNMLIYDSRTVRYGQKMLCSSSRIQR